MVVYDPNNYAQNVLTAARAPAAPCFQTAADPKEAAMTKPAWIHDANPDAG